MFIALDKDGNRVSAEQAERKQEYRCQLCNEIVTLKRGAVKCPHFAHKSDTNCDFDRLYGDNKGEWHRKMQSLFPVDCQEVRMEENGEVHIADIYLKDKNTVIEFQHSPMDAETMYKRTRFYIGIKKCRLIWVFDETYPSKPNTNERIGRFEKACFRKINIASVKVEIPSYWWNKVRSQFPEFFKMMRCSQTSEIPDFEILFDVASNDYPDNKSLRKLLIPFYNFQEVLLSSVSFGKGNLIDPDVIFFTEEKLLYENVEWFRNEHDRLHPKK